MIEIAPAIRRANPDEAAELTAIMHRSKAYWGYSSEFMTLFRDSMIITPQNIGEGDVFVLELDRRILGFLHLKYLEGHSHLEDLFIEPDAIGKGYGKQLFVKAVELTRVAGYHEMTLEADPNAEPFYLRLGVRRVGQRASAVPGRFLPQMSYTLSE